MFLFKSYPRVPVNLSATGAGTVGTLTLFILFIFIALVFITQVKTTEQTS